MNIWANTSSELTGIFLFIQNLRPLMLSMVKKKCLKVYRKKNSITGKNGELNLIFYHGSTLLFLLFNGSMLKIFFNIIALKCLKFGGN